jgi:hypothetical protein
MSGTAKSGSYFRECIGYCVRRFHGDVNAYAFILVYAAFSVLLLRALDRPDLSTLDNYLMQGVSLFLLVLPLMLVIFETLSIYFRIGFRRPGIYRRIFSARHVAHAMSGTVLLMAMMLFMGSFTSIKNVLPIIGGGFPFDKVLADFDRWLHLGNQPFKLLYSVIGSPVVLGFLQWNYTVMWFMLSFGALFFVVVSPRAAAIRARYLGLFMFVWVFCGNVLAGLLLSAGPVYYRHVTGDEERFAVLRAFVDSMTGPQSPSFYQSYLWNLYENGMSGLGSGISAFPSVHVGLMTLNVLFFGGLSKVHAVIGAAYLVIIMASSVLLGWHYAIDGYVSALVVTAAYLFVTQIVPKFSVRWGVETGRETPRMASVQE